MAPTREAPVLFAEMSTDVVSPDPVKGPGFGTVMNADCDAADHGAQSVGVSGDGAVTVMATLND
jgi:hypothetical protein